MDKEKTAIQSILDIVEMDNRNHVEISMSVFIGMLKKGLEAEKKQIVKACKIGASTLCCGENYYNEKYGKQ